MKKRLLIICSIIVVLLAGFQFPIYAETTPSDYSSSTSIMASTPLDQYFYDNYELLPYIESNGNQYINTDIKASSDLKINLKLSNPTGDGSYLGVFGNNRKPRLSVSVTNMNGRLQYWFNSLSYSFSYTSNDYSVHYIEYDKNDIYFDNSLIHTFEYNQFNSDENIYLFGVAPDNALSSFKVYNFSIYDYAANDGEGALVRDYYPARAKSSGVLGLYDAVSKTFVTTSGSVPFELPDGDPVNLSLGAYITQFLSGSLSWIGAIFEGINEMPIIWVFIAIALAGVAFRWARRIVHF